MTAAVAHEQTKPDPNQNFFERAPNIELPELRRARFDAVLKQALTTEWLSRNKSAASKLPKAACTSIVFDTDGKQIFPNAHVRLSSGRKYVNAAALKVVQKLNIPNFVESRKVRKWKKRFYADFYRDRVNIYSVGMIPDYPDAKF